jgi:hypothetical protein
LEEQEIGSCGLPLWKDEGSNRLTKEAICGVKYAKGVLEEKQRCFMKSRVEGKLERWKRKREGQGRQHES